MKKKIKMTGVERFFDPDRFLVSKTDLKGVITYANQVFADVAEYKEEELLNKPHSIIRHPDMPRCVFKLLWDTIQDGREIFAYVVNRSKYNNHYWVFAHVTPSYDDHGNITGYHSNRRVPNRETLDNVIIPLYKTLLKEEERFENSNEGMESAFNMLLNILKEKGLSYDEFILSI